MKKGRSEKICQSFWNTSPLRGRIERIMHILLGLQEGKL
jgi:hypothetical protein